MKVRIVMTLVFFTAVSAGCRQHGNSPPGAPAVTTTDAGPNAAIDKAIRAHLAHNTNLRIDSFDMELKQVTYDGDHAKAQVEFHAKSGNGTMQLTYSLAKRDGTWSVIESTPNGSNFSHPPLDKTQGSSTGGKTGENSSVFQVLDKIQGGLPSSTQTLPPGHPPVSTTPKKQQP